MQFRVLLVEDNPGDARLLQMMLSTATESQFIVETAETLQEGLAALRRNKFDLILLDLNLPDSRGIQTVRTVLCECPDCPILVLTGGDDDQLAAQSVSEGAQDYLTKGNLLNGTLTRALRHAIERHRIRKKLQDSEELFKLISENACDLISVTKPNGIRIYASPSYKRLLGYDPEQLKGTSGYDQIHPDDHAQVREYLNQVDPGVPRRPLVYRMRHNDDGTWRYLESTRSVVRDGDREVSKIVSISRDVTDRIALEAQFLQSQKMEAVGRLSPGVAHDFNNLLGVVIGYSEFLQEKLELGHPLRASVDEISKSGKRAALLTRQLLAFSRQQVFDLKPLALNAIVRDVESLLRRIIGEHIILETLLDPQLGTIKADQSQIEQVLVNLAINARDAMPHGGTLRIETRNEEIDASFAHRFHPHWTGPQVCLIVQDNGVGMDEATSARVFEPFFITSDGLLLSCPHCQTRSVYQRFEFTYHVR
jgi:two-component system, cell cycle sensor histidine kinase and response regulator CckA